MLDKFLNKKVNIYIASYAYRADIEMTSAKKKGVITSIDSEFIELDNNDVIAIKYILEIKLAE